jgi:parallel beta-helix repeat protein
MKKKILGIAVCMLLIITVFPVSATALSEKTFPSLTTGNTLYVGGSGPNNYTKIQDAINDAVNGDTIFVYDDSSPYYENIIIEKSITLIGEMRETTCILGDNSSDAIVNISADDVSISGFTIQAYMGQPEGILIVRHFTSPDYWNIDIIQNATICDTSIKNTSSGIFGIRLNHGKLIGNIIENCRGSGILLYIPSNSTITNNCITSSFYRGIHIDGLWGPYRILNHRNPVPENNIISYNIVRSNRWGIELNSGTVNTTISDNNITGNHEIGIQIFQASKTEITRNNFFENSKNAYFDAVCVIRYPRFMQNTWDNNYWGEPKDAPVRINGTFYFIPFPRLPLSISFPNYEFNFKELPWVAFDWHPAQEPYDIGG